jgi:hypothetical protein
MRAPVGPPIRKGNAYRLDVFLCPSCGRYREVLAGPGQCTACFADWDVEQLAESLIEAVEDD